MARKMRSHVAIGQCRQLRDGLFPMDADAVRDDSNPILAGSVPGAPGPGSVTWKLHREIALLAGWGRAILLQLAHPLVAQGVARHSGFAADPGGHVRRLRRTLGAMLALTFGNESEARRAAEAINRIHDRVHGALDARQGAYPAGTPYTAHDPALLAWVHATLLDSFLLTYEVFVGPLSDEERDRYCDEARRVEPALGIPTGRLPRTRAELSGYMVAMLAGADIAVTDTARSLARQVLHPPLARPLRPLLALARLPAVGLLPPRVRAAYGLTWSPGQERALRLLAASSRRVLPLLPSRLRDWPAARTAFARDA
jgi:uncharacterized protein (DUF2236 family)